jgi:hypothetical protein
VNIFAFLQYTLLILHPRFFKQNIYEYNMYGRGRGSYLGLLLESQIGKRATASTINSAKGKTSDNVLINVENSLSSPRQSVPSTSTISSYPQGI